jgi:hypothetical protein
MHRCEKCGQPFFESKKELEEHFGSARLQIIRDKEFLEWLERRDRQ